MTVIEKLEAMAAEHERIAVSIRTTLALLQETGRRAARGQLAKKLAGAVKTRKAAAPPKGSRRQQTATFLAQFGPTPRTPKAAVEAAGLPSPLIARTVGSLVRHGYLKKKGDGYVRTPRAYAVAPGSVNGNGASAH
jgi:hypothetical protein